MGQDGRWNQALNKSYMDKNSSWPRFMLKLRRLSCKSGFKITEQNYSTKQWTENYNQTAEMIH